MSTIPKFHSQAKIVSNLLLVCIALHIFMHACMDTLQVYVPQHLNHHVQP